MLDVYRPSIKHITICNTTSLTRAELKTLLKLWLNMVHIKGKERKQDWYRVKLPLISKAIKLTQQKEDILTCIIYNGSF